MVSLPLLTFPFVIWWVEKVLPTKNGKQHEDAFLAQHNCRISLLWNIFLEFCSRRKALSST